MNTLVMVTGGCGYVGSRLVPHLVSKGYSVRVVDTQWFGNFLVPSDQIEIRRKSIRELEISDFDSINSVIHLANIANDPSVDLIRLSLGRQTYLISCMSWSCLKLLA